MNIVLADLSDTIAEAALELAPLDVPLRIECPQLALSAVAKACAGWEGAPAGLCALLCVRIERSPARAGSGRVEIEFAGSVLTVRGPGVAARADVEQGYATCAVSDRYLADPDALRTEVLEPLVLMMLAHRDRTPVHASAFIIDGVAVLLAGRAGAGKSCLARAADAAGFQALSDDTVYVEQEPRLRIWGWPSAAHLLPQDAPDRCGPTRLRGGKVKHVVPLRSASQAALACDRAILCLLSRADGAPSLRRVAAEAVAERLWPLDEGFDLLPGPIARAVARLAANGAWELRLSADPAEAVRLLAAGLSRLRQTAAG